jgi:hypothetical protein
VAALAALKVRKGQNWDDECKLERNKTWKTSPLMRSGSIQNIDEVEEFGKQVRHGQNYSCFAVAFHPLHFSHLCRLVFPSLIQTVTIAKIKIKRETSR